MLTYRTGVVTSRPQGESTIYVVEYTSLGEERASRYDWGGSREGLADTVRYAARRGDSFPTYELPSDWVVEWETDPRPASAFEGLDPDTLRQRAEAQQQQIEQYRASIRELTERLNSALTSEIEDVNDPRLTRLWDRAADAADTAGFCSEYDRLCDELGIPGRERTYRGVVTVTFNVYAYARSRSIEDATEEMEEAVTTRVREVMATGGYGEAGAISHVDINDSEVEEVSVYD